MLIFFLTLLPFSACDQTTLQSQGRMPLLVWLAERSSYASGQFVLFSNANFLRFDLCACLFPPSISKMTENIGKEAALRLMLASQDETMPGSGYSTQNSPPQLARTGYACCQCMQTHKH